MVNKIEVRKSIKAQRKEMSAAQVKEKSQKISKLFLDSSIYQAAKQLMIYMPLGNEVDTEVIVQSAFTDGKQLLFPVTDAESGELTPYYADENTEFKKGAFSVNEPQSERKADIKKIDVVVVPGIAFDRKGNRVGFGKGCYDKFLSKTDAVRVGICYDFQLCEAIETNENDVKMDFLITENELIMLKGMGK